MSYTIINQGWQKVPTATAERLEHITMLVNAGQEHEARQHAAALIGRVDIAAAYRRLGEDCQRPTPLWTIEDYWVALSTLDKYMLLPAVKAHKQGGKIAAALLG